MNARCLPLLAGALCLTGCVLESTGPTRHESSSIDLGSAERLAVELHMGAGNLNIRGNAPAQKLAQTDFTYNIEAWKPEVRYTNSSARSTLNITQPGTNHAHMGDTKYDWTLALNNDVPVELTVHFGAGEAHLDLGSLPLRGVEVHMGVGSLQMDLRGKPKHDYDVQFHGGSGEAIGPLCS